VDGVRLAKKHMFFSIDRAKHELGFAPRPVEEALRDAVAWFQQHGYLKSKNPVVRSQETGDRR
jgi:dihydroflavonol-4-reductase